MSEYRVFISRKNLDDKGQTTEDVEIAHQLYDHLTSLGVSTFLDDVSLIQQGAGRYKQAIDDALDQAQILVAVGTSRENLESEWVRYEWDGFFNDIISGIKPDSQVVSLISGLKPANLPRALRQTQAFDYHREGIIQAGQFIISALDLNEPEQSPSRQRQKQRTVVNESTSMETAILFIDIAGSSKLFKEHGDEIAARILQKAIRDWTKITEQHSGWVIKALGDEIMCAFETSDDCVMAATEIREEISIGLRGESIAIRVRMGLGFGPAIRTPDRDVLGNTVNIASEMTGKAEADQILIDESTVNSLSKNLKKRCSKVGESPFKGSDFPVLYFEIV